LTRRLDALLEEKGVALHRLSVEMAERVRLARREYAARVGISVEARTKGLEEDSGCKVFGEGGLPKVRMVALIDLLRKIGFKPFIFFRQRKEGDERTHFKVLLTTGADVSWAEYLAVNFPEQEPARNFPINFYGREFVPAVFNYAHVYANPRDQFGHVIHSVNSIKILPEYVDPNYRLDYNEGLWAAFPLA
jgi:hypothetical protein